MRNNLKKWVCVVVALLVFIGSTVYAMPAPDVDTDSSTQTERRVYSNEDFIYEVLSDNTVTIHFYIGSDEIALVPQKIDGYEVKTIESHAFYETQVKDLVISEGITTIEDEAFYNCSVETAQLPSTLKSVGMGIFRYCTNLKTVAISEGATLGQYMFYGCTSLVNVALPADCHAIEMGMFAYCTSLRNINLPSVVYEIFDYSFYGSGLVSLSIPEDLEHIGSKAFAQCTALEEITLRDSNTVCAYIAEDAFEGCPAQLPSQWYPEASTTAVPATTPSVGDFFESPHPYSENMDKTWTVEHNDADYIALTFSDETYVEENWDCIRIYDRKDRLVGEYTGDMLAAQTIYVAGDVAKVQLETDSSFNYYGFYCEWEAGYGDVPENPTFPEPEIPASTEADVFPSSSPDYPEPGAPPPFSTMPPEPPTTMQTDPTETITAPVYETTTPPMTECPATMATEAETVPPPATNPIYTEAATTQAPLTDGYLTDEGFFIGTESGFFDFEGETARSAKDSVANNKKELLELAWNVRTRGDVNNDNLVNVKDATAIQKHCAGIALPVFVYKNADVNTDGKVNVKDATAIQKFIAGIGSA